MIKKLLGIGLCMLTMFCATAQNPQLQPLPLNPKVKAGKLPNGLSYYIMHNEEPKERANFYIAQKVGSTLEEKNQLGLAHFLEHMAFNGLEHFPGKSMLNYLQNKGIRFGADINAYTAFDETVYNIDNVPTTDAALMDSVLLVLHDWSGSILLEDAEIDAERGVIQEEWRSRNDANFRMLSTVLPAIYEEYQYEQTPIGSMDVVMNFKPETLRAYYKKWYRPDQQGIVIVGDFDADAMEKKVKDLFSSIQMPENAAERKYPHVSDNVEPIYVAFSDPELQMPRTTISFKTDKWPMEMRNTVQYYMESGILQSIIESLINTRIGDNAQNPECTYMQGGVYFGDYWVSKTKDSFNVVAIPKKSTQSAVAEVMGIVARACKTGFTESELEIVKNNFLASYEKAFNEREKTTNGAYGKELYRHFIDNEPAPGIETEYEIAKSIIPMLTADAINSMIPNILTKENMVIVTTEPQKEGFEIVAKDVLVKTITDAMDAQYEAMADEKITEPLISKLPVPGKIVKSTENAKLGVKELVLSNGAKVVLKSTDFAADEITMIAFRDGGKQAFGKNQAHNVKMLDDAVALSKMGPFDNKNIRKYLAGKKAGVSFSVNNYTDVVNGSATVKDLPTMMELVYTLFTNVNPDEDTYKVAVQNVATQLNNMKTNPDYILGKHIEKAQYPDNPLMYGITEEDLQKMSYAEMLDMGKSILSNAAEYTFIFVGNFEEKTILPLIEQYIATLPAGKVKPFKPVTEITLADGVTRDEFKQPMQTPGTTVFDVMSGNNVPFNLKNVLMLNIVSDVLQIIYTNTLREEEGGTYGASVGANLNPTTHKWLIQYSFKTNKDQQAQLMKRAQDELLKLLSEGANIEDFNKVKSAMQKQYEISVRRNGYWQNNLMSFYRGYDYISGYAETLDSITLDDLNKFMKNLYDGKNRIEVVMEGVEAN